MDTPDHIHRRTEEWRPCLSPPTPPAKRCGSFEVRAAALAPAPTGAAPKLLPFPLEPYLQSHFSKLSCQTLLGMKRLVAAGEEHGLSVASLRALLQMAQDARVFTDWRDCGGERVPA